MRSPSLRQRSDGVDLRSGARRSAGPGDPDDPERIQGRTRDPPPRRTAGERQERSRTGVEHRGEDVLGPVRRGSTTAQDLVGEPFPRRTGCPAMDGLLADPERTGLAEGDQPVLLLGELEEWIHVHDDGERPAPREEGTAPRSPHPVLFVRSQRW